MTHVTPPPAASGGFFCPWPANRDAPGRFYDDAEGYDLLCAALEHPHERRFYRDLARSLGTPARILDLGCGTGRLTLDWAQDGHHVTGLDRSEAMLRHAEAKAHALAVSVQWVEADCRDFTVAERFDLIAFPANGLCHLTDPADVRACLLKARAHARPGGQLVLELFNPWLPRTGRATGERAFLGRYTDRAGRALALVEEHRFEPETGLSHLTWITRHGRETVRVRELDLRLYPPQETEALLRSTGWRVERCYGDFDLSPLTEDAPAQILVCTQTA